MVTYARATLADLDALVEAWVALADEQRAHGSHVSPEENRDRLKEEIGMAVMDDGVVVARSDANDGSDDDLLGFVTFGVQSESLARDVTRGVLWNAWVTPARRGEGIGSALFDAAERELADRGVDAIVLDVLAENRAARRLYRRRGYRPHRVEMEKGLDDESDTHTN